jgi:hypothetical protein
LLKEVRAAIEQRATQPSIIHRFIAALPASLRAQGKPGQLCLLTTNYDTLMEHALTEAREHFISSTTSMMGAAGPAASLVRDLERRSLMKAG